jgi:hypothetical protein
MGASKEKELWMIPVQYLLGTAYTFGRMKEKERKKNPEAPETQTLAACQLAKSKIHPLYITFNIFYHPLSLILHLQLTIQSINNLWCVATVLGSQQETIQQ